jgi:integrase
MPRVELMGWVPSLKRWQKSYKGSQPESKLYTVSCHQLHCPPTKEASRQLANEWWLAKQRELDGAPVPRGTVRTLAERRADYEQLRRIDTTAYQQVVECLGIWQAWADAARVTAVNADVCQSYYSALQQRVIEGRWSPATAQKVWYRFKQWLTYLADMGHCDTPGIVRRLRFTQKPPRVVVVEPGPYLAGASSRLRLYYLLMLNCGMYQADIASLRRDECGPNSITRRRSKTPDGPITRYPLWDDTAALLHRHMAPSGELALLTERGRPLVRRFGRRYDTVHGMHRRHCISAGLDHVALKQFRKVSANLLHRHSHYCRYVEMFLAHSPRSVSDRFYLAADDAGFREAILWLGTQVLISS